MKVCVCRLKGSTHRPWCDYYPGGPMLTAPDGSSWDMWDDPDKIARKHREKTGPRCDDLGGKHDLS